MAGQYSHLQFFRRTPNALLARYFHEKHGVLQEIAFDKLKETEVDPIFRGFTVLPDDKQAQIEAECQDIDAMACQGGVTALTDEAEFHHDNAFPAAISKIDGFHGAVMWAFLEHTNYWTGATLLLQADNISESLWEKRSDLPHLPPHVEDEDTLRLAQAISQYFHTKEGRGRNCKVEVFRRYEKEYFFAYPEDFAQSGREWVRNALATRARHPAFEIIFVYCQAEGSLDIYASRNTKSVLNKPTESPIRQTDSETGSPEWRRQTARTAANARHDQPGGSRDKQRQMREIWASGKYQSRDICAEQECAALGMSFSAARKALRTKRPTHKP